MCFVCIVKCNVQIIRMMVCNAYVDQCNLYAHQLQASTDDVTKIAGVLKQLENTPDGFAQLEREPGVARQALDIVPHEPPRGDIVPYQPPRVDAERQVVPWKAQTTGPRR